LLSVLLQSEMGRHPLAAPRANRSAAAQHEPKSDGGSSSESALSAHSAASAMASPATVNLQNVDIAKIPYLTVPPPPRRPLDNGPEWWMHSESEGTDEADAGDGGRADPHSPDGLSSRSNSFLSLSMDDALRSHSGGGGASSPQPPPLSVLEGALSSDHRCGDLSENELLRDADEAEEGEMVRSYVLDVLEENIERGDIQTATAIIVALWDEIGHILSDEEVADIVLSYLSLLVSGGLLTEAVALFERTKGNELVRRHFLTPSHRLIARCVRHKAVMKQYQCLDCLQTPKCTDCGEHIFDQDALQRLRPSESRGDEKRLRLLVWCQICGHGAHFDCAHRDCGGGGIGGGGAKSTCSADGCHCRCHPVLIEMPCR